LRPDDEGNAVDDGNTGNPVSDSDMGSAMPDGDVRDETPSRSWEKKGSSGSGSASGDVGNAMFSGEHVAKVALAGDVGKLVQGLVRAVSRDGVHEKLEYVGDGYPESRSS
jgi:hypothetical protein